jgi:hypothetical protein
MPEAGEVFADFAGVATHAGHFGRVVHAVDDDALTHD